MRTVERIAAAHIPRAHGRPDRSCGLDLGAVEVVTLHLQTHARARVRERVGGWAGAGACVCTCGWGVVAGEGAIVCALRRCAVRSACVAVLSCSTRARPGGSASML